MAPTLSGQKTVTTAGTAVQLHTGLSVDGPVMIKALPANTGVMYVGNVSGDVTNLNSMPLSAGDPLILNRVGNLADVWIDATVNGEGVAWLILTI